MCLILYDDIIWARRIVTRKVKVSKLSNEMLSIPFFIAECSHWVQGKIS